MQKWLNCIISKGMFSDEFLVSFKTRSGEDVAVFVPCEMTEKCPDRVMVSYAVVLLPDADQTIIETESVYIN